MNKTNKISKNILFFVMIISFFVLLSAISTVSAVDLTQNDTEIVTNTDDINIVDQDLSNSNATINNKDLNIKNSKLNKSKLYNNGGNVSILDSTIKNSNLTFTNNDEIIIKNSKFYNTVISITGAQTVYLINCSFVNSSVNLSSTNLLTLDLIINKTSNVNLTTDHIWFGGIIFVNDHSNFYINVSKTRSGISGNTNNSYYKYSIAFPKAYELAGFTNSENYNYQLIMVNGSSNATGYINDSTKWRYDIFTFSSSDSNDAILGAYEITDHNSNGTNNNLGHGDIDFYAQFGYTYIKAPNGTIYKIVRDINFNGYYYNYYGGNSFGFNSFYDYIDNSIYNYYSSHDAYFYFEDINYTWQWGNWYYNYLGSISLFSMMLDYNDTGFTNNYGAIAQNVHSNNYYTLIKDVYIYNNYLRIYLNDVYNMTYLMVDINSNDYWYVTSGYGYYLNNEWIYYYINNLDDLINAISGELYHNNTGWQNIFLYQNIKYVDENGTVLSTEDMNILFSLLALQINAQYSAIKYNYDLYGMDGILMLLNVNMSDPDEVDQVMADIGDFINEYNQIIDDIVIDQIGIDIWKIVVVPSNSTINGTDNNQTLDNNQTPNNNQTPDNNQTPGNNQIPNNPKPDTPSNKVTPKKVDLAIQKVKKVKSKNKQVVVYKITIQNKGNLKSGKATLSIWHIRKNVKTKVKIVNVKALKPGQKITLIVKYYPDSKGHKLCKQEHFALNPSKNIKESTYANNKKVLKT